MPYYQFLVPEGGRTLAHRAEIAAEFTKVHVEVTGAPADYVYCSFTTTNADSVFVVDRAVDHATMVGLIRSGRSPEIKRELLTRLAQAWSTITGEPIESHGLWLCEIPGAQMMEGGVILPEASEDPNARR